MSAGTPAPAPAKGSTSSATAWLPPTSLSVGGPSYSSVAARAPRSPKLAPVPLGSRPATQVNNIPAILLTQTEEEQLCKQRKNTLIMKFSAGRPTPYAIRSHIHSEWKLDAAPAVGVIDHRHVSIHMASAADTKRALARPSNKINTNLYRLFRWTPDFEVGRESSFTAVWVKMHNLPLHYFNETALHRLGSLLGTVLTIHSSTINLTQQAYAKVCIEMDVAKPFADNLWIGTSKEYGWTIELEYEGNHAYCDYCGILGHTIGLCKKKRAEKGKAKVTNRKDFNSQNQANASNISGQSEQWVAKKHIDEAPQGQSTHDMTRHRKHIQRKFLSSLTTVSMTKHVKHS